MIVGYVQGFRRAVTRRSAAIIPFSQCLWHTQPHMTRKYIKSELSNDPDVVNLKRLAPPRNLSAAAKKIFRRIVNSLPACHFESSDLEQLINYADIHAEIDECKATIASEGRVYEDEKGVKHTHPFIRDLNALRSASTALAVKLQLNPRARGSGLTKAAQRKKATAHDKVERSDGKRSADLLYMPGGKT